MKRSIGVLFGLCGVLPFAQAGIIEKAQQEEAAAAQQAWSAWGGDVGFRWNRDLLGILGVTVETQPRDRIEKSDRRRHEWFNVRDGASLKFLVRNGALKQFSGGSLQMRGGYVLRLTDGTVVDLRELTLRVRQDGSNILDVVGGDGKAWFYIDRVMFELVDDKRTLAIQAADMRMTPEFAARIGRTEAAGWAIADLALNTRVYVQGSDETVEGTCSPYPWPGTEVPGAAAKYQADLFMERVDFQTAGCQNCDGPGGANDGIVSFVPNSTLKNNVNNGTAQATIPGDPLGTSAALYTANIAWYTMFTGNNPPYGNDQHPFLIWNLYRINAADQLDQIGRSGVKHAWLTTNSGCADSCYNSHALGRSCSDTYSTFNNDNPGDLGPRSEVVPAIGIWGRCGSIWDPDCTGSGNRSNSNDDWTQRLKTRESQVDPAANPSARFMVDSWYVARDDINIYNSMATMTAIPRYGSGLWTLSGQSNYRLGAAIDRWVDPAAPGALARNTELANGEGHAKLAVKVKDLGNNTWRYDYAVMNFDFARAVTQGSVPNVRVLSNKGFDRFAIPIPEGAVVSATRFSDGDVDASNDWSVNVGTDQVVWTAPAGGNTLDWGTLFSFSLTVNAASRDSNGELHVAQSGTPESYLLSTLAPDAGRVVPVVPSATVSTTSMNLSVETGGNATDSLTIGNSGDPTSSLDFTVGEAPSTCATAGDVSWLSAAPTSGSVPSGSSVPVSLTATAGALAVGVYSGKICVGSNDPAHPTIEVAVSLTVHAPAVYSIGGTVNGLTGGGLVLKNGSSNLPVGAAGAFTFPDSVPNGTAYSVTVGTQPSNPPQICTVTNGNGTIDAANVTNIAVSCALDDHIFVNGFELQNGFGTRR